MKHGYITAYLIALIACAAPAAAQVERCAGVPPNVMCAGPVLATDTLEWTAPENATSITAATTLEYRVRVDNATTFTVITTTKTCSGPQPPYLCRALVPAALLSALSIGLHPVTMTAFDSGAGIGGAESPLSAPFRLYMAAGCSDGTATPVPVGKVIGERSQFSTLMHATRVAQLRLWGWDVSWQRAQFERPSSPSSSDGGYWYIVAFCTGVPK